MVGECIDDAILSPYVPEEGAKYVEIRQVGGYDVPLKEKMIETLCHRHKKLSMGRAKSWVVRQEDVTYVILQGFPILIAVRKSVYPSILNAMGIYMACIRHGVDHTRWSFSITACTWERTPTCDGWYPSYSWSMKGEKEGPEEHGCLDASDEEEGEREIC